MTRTDDNADALYHIDYYGNLTRLVWVVIAGGRGRAIAGGVLRSIFPAMAIILLAACSGGGGGTASTQTPVTIPTGSIQLAGRIKPIATALTPGAASPDWVKLQIDEAAISTDGGNYETLVTGGDLDSRIPSSPLVEQSIGGKKAGFATGTYKALKVTASNIDWGSVAWTFSNPSPCDGTASGTASGSLDLSSTPTLYFKTADLGGNTALYYQGNPPLAGYVGDADHPLLLPTPIQVLQDETTTVSLVVETKDTIGCSHLSVFNAADSGSVLPLREIVGPATGLFGLSGLWVDTKRNQLIVTDGITNGINSGLTIYSLGDTGDVKPLRSFDGPVTKLNNPVAVTLYNAGQAGGSGDEYIVLNRDNDSIVTFAASDSGNAVPVRTLWGLFSGLSEPSGMALNLDLGGDPAKDEILVTNSGNNTVTTYARLATDDSFPLVTLEGSATELNHPCGIALDKTDREVLVTNSNSNSITVYDLQDLDASNPIIDPNSGAQVTNPHVNIPPLLTITTPNASSDKLSDPCGIAIDSGEMYVANKGNNSISVFDLAALQTAIQDPATPSIVAAPTRTLSGGGLNQPVGIQISGGELWVTHNGGQAEMARAPRIVPVVSNESSTANSTLAGDYNIVRFGIDLHKGINGWGSEIPILHAERGVVNFDPQAVNGASLSFQRDALVKQFKRQVMEPGCDKPDLNVKTGFFGVGADNSFYAFTQEDQGVINGTFLANGEGFSAVSYDNDEMYVVYGTKATGSSIPYLGDNGTDSGSPAYYAYVNYTNVFQNISRFLDPPLSDLFKYMMYVGYVYSDPQQFYTLFADTNSVAAYDPIGEYKAPSVSIPHNSSTLLTGAAGKSQNTMHSGGLLESAGYGIAGAVSGDSQSLIFINDVTSVDTNDCQIAAGIGVALRQGTAGTFKTSDIKGTYFIAGIGDHYQTPIARDKYFSMAGSISFDGGGTATMVQTENSEGEIKSSSNTYSYQVIATKVPTANTVGGGPQNVDMDVLRLFSSDSATAPYAQALIGMDGKLLAFFQAGDTRLLGFGLLQKQ